MIQAGDIAAINLTRRTLKELKSIVRSGPEDESARDAFSRGKLHETIETAEDGLFDILNVAKSYCLIDISPEQLRGE
jgi:hypothetical protein